MEKYKFGACLPTFGSCADRFVLSGYGGGGETVEEMLALAAQVPFLEGVELVGNWHINDDNIQKIKQLLSDMNLSACMLVPDLWTQAKWGKGSFAASSEKTRKEAIAEVKKVMDWAVELDCKYIDLWFGQDGYDYCFQADFESAWENLALGVAECADYRKDIFLCIEYKIKEPKPIITEQSLSLNFTNEGGVGGTYRFLRNVAGLWLVQECKRIWEKSGRAYEYEELTKLAAEAESFLAFIDPDHGSFLNPADMPASIAQFCERTGQRKPATIGEIIRCILESIALKHKVVLEMLVKLHGPVKRLHIVGGGARNHILCQFLANATHLPVIAGPAEATSIGNIIMQVIAEGILPSIEEGRNLISRSFELINYEPQEVEIWEKNYQRFLEIL